MIGWVKSWYRKIERSLALIKHTDDLVQSDPIIAHAEGTYLLHASGVTTWIAVFAIGKPITVTKLHPDEGPRDISCEGVAYLRRGDVIVAKSKLFMPYLRVQYLGR